VPRLRILFLLLAVNFDRVFANFLEELLERGHEVRVVVEKQKATLPAGAGSMLDTLAERYPSFSYGPEPPRSDDWLSARTGCRHALDYLRHLEPAFGDAHDLRERASGRVPALVLALDRPLRASPWARRLAAAALRRFEALLPIDAGVRAQLLEAAPDVVLVSPLVGLGSKQSDWLRTALELGIPTVLPVASWDNLTNKGVLKQLPTLTIVWNEAQADEAVAFHGVPRERVRVTGAHAFDHWFDWRASRSRESFLAEVGLPTGPYVVYAGSSEFITGDETAFAREWIERLRRSSHASVRELGVLVRPHPQNAGGWPDFEAGDDRVAVWPRAGASPTDDALRADYFDSLTYGAGVFGINTSALVEASVLRRPSFTLVTDHFRGKQEGTLHFAYVAGDGGPVVTAHSWDEHHEQLAAELARPGLNAVPIERFLESFIRPNGLAQPGSPLAAEAVEEAAAMSPEPLRPGIGTRLARRAFARLSPDWKQPARRLRRRLRSAP
jgi:hypothetical protein